MFVDGLSICVLLFVKMKGGMFGVGFAVGRGNSKR